MIKRYLPLALAIGLIGCGSVNSTTPPLAPGYFNSADQQMGSVLSGARTFYSTIQCETKGMNWSQSTSTCVADPTITTLTLSATEKSAFNGFGVTLNAAEAIYNSYHLGTSTQAAAQEAVDTVKAKQDALPALAVTK